MDAALRRLAEAVDREDWADAADADAAFARVLTRYLGATLSVTERDALANAHAEHAALRRRCEAACGRLETRIAEARAHKEGWIAYAMHVEPREGAA
ncbi:hypothetical protein [Aromatoleum sp.]|uniref:hypothetical protein n=1 Tax=Aromatoleum sp. TaxID=2307007 RepID=UPI002FC79F5F